MQLAGKHCAHYNGRESGWYLSKNSKNLTKKNMHSSHLFEVYDYPRSSGRTRVILKFTVPRATFLF